jgi:ribose transport system permease protein
VQSHGVIGALVVVCVAASVAFPSFPTAANFSAIAMAACFIGLMTIGQTFVLISGGIDLSVGSMIGLATVVAALAAPYGWAAALLAPLAVGALVGLVNGLLIGKARMAPFIDAVVAAGAQGRRGGAGVLEHRNRLG